jgi:hypothetical protein
MKSIRKDTEMLIKIDANQVTITDMIFIDNQFNPVWEVKEAHSTGSYGHATSIQYGWLKESKVFSSYADVLIWRN